MANIYDLIIIGGGPAGITAGIYAGRHGLKTLLISNGFGGQMTKKTVAIENYTGFDEISGFELIQKFEKHLKKQNIEIKISQIIDIKKDGDIFLISDKDNNIFSAKAVILATGAEPRTLGVPGEKEFIGRGVSYCVACDGPIFAKKTVVVAGGGNSAFEAAIFLSSIAKKIFIIERSDSLRADETLQKKVRTADNIEIMIGQAIKEIHGDKFVNSVICQDLKNGQQTEITLDGIFVEIGHQPAVGFVKNLVDLTDRNEIMINLQNNQTKTPGLFAAGDVSNLPYKQIIISAGQGAQAALSALAYIKKVS
jgi:thioredoxin-disulfide reductase